MRDSTASNLEIVKTAAILLLVGGFILMGLFSLADGMPSEEEIANAAYSTYGVTNVQNVQQAWLGCGEDDFYRFSFEGKDRNGSLKSYVYCKGITKGATIRLSN